MANIGRTAGAWLAFRNLGLRDDPLALRYATYVRARAGDVFGGHSSLMQHVLLAGLASQAMGIDPARDYWAVCEREMILARAPDGSFQPRPWHESRNSASNVDVMFGEIWTTACWTPPRRVRRWPWRCRRLTTRRSRKRNSASSGCEPMLLVSLALSALLAASPAGPLRFQVEVKGYADARVIVIGPEADLAPGPFRGTVSVNGSAAELPITGAVTHADGKFRLASTVRYTDIPVAWTEGFRTPPGQAYYAVESPRGEMGFFMQSDGSAKPYRCHERSGVFASLQAMPLVCRDGLVSDLIAVIASWDPILGEIDR